MDKNLTHDMLREAGWGERRGMGFSALVGPLWSRREGDGWAYGLLTGEQHANQAGLVHGGLLATLMDQALSAVAWEALQRQPCVTVQLDTHYLALPVPGSSWKRAARSCAPPAAWCSCRAISAWARP